MNGSHPESSAFGFGIAAISLLVLPVLGVMKLRLSGRLGSPALRGDSVLTLAAAALAAITLVALLANSALGWWWADPIAALLIALALATEAEADESSRALRANPASARLRESGDQGSRSNGTVPHDGEVREPESGTD